MYSMVLPYIRLCQSVYCTDPDCVFSLVPQRCRVSDSLSLSLKGLIKPSCVSALSFASHHDVCIWCSFPLHLLLSSSPAFLFTLSLWMQCPVVCLLLTEGKRLSLSSEFCLSGFVDSNGQLASDRQNTIILTEEAESPPKAFGQSCCPASLFVSNTENLLFCVILKV